MPRYQREVCSHLCWSAEVRAQTSAISAFSDLRVLSERPFELFIFLFLPSPSAPQFPSQRFVVTPCDITTHTQAQSSGLKMHAPENFLPPLLPVHRTGASTVWGETTGSVSTISPHWPQGTPRRFLPGNPLLHHGKPREGSGAALGTLRPRPKLQN